MLSRALSVAVLATAIIGCGGSSASYQTSGASGDVGYSEAPPPEAAYRGGGGGDDDYELSSISVEASMDSGGDFGAGESEEWANFQDEEAPEQRRRLAQKAPSPAPRPSPQGSPTGGQTQEQEQATDAVDTSGPLLIYTAELHLGVYEVEDTQNSILAAVQELGGFMSRRSDTELVLRIPVAHFRDALTAIEGAGDVIHRNIEAIDVSEEFRDIEIRVRNAEAMRDRLEQLLRQANDVEAALAIERELQRLTERIETMKGRIRFLADRISFSTITVRFQVRNTENIDQPDVFRLPFPWLDDLGLQNLLTL